MTDQQTMSVTEYRRLMGVDAPIGASGCPVPASGAAPAATPPKPKRSKYGNVKTEVDGEVLDSRLEARRYVVLQTREAAGVIRDLRRQIPYALTVNGELIGSYLADFVYFDCTLKRVVVEDCKSKPTTTDLFRWKAKHMRAEHRVDISIVESADA